MSFSFLDMIILAVLCLFGIGIYALLTMRNLIRIIVALQLLVKSVILFVILAGNITGQMALAQSMAATVIVADTIVAVLGMALAVQIKRKTNSLDTKDIASLRR
ncbi:MAG: NADH-quinone oxidoreductase subunit K [Anaerolineaceae bacterium]|nr:NADH-quinone oxidoreductase subunit K [Anaerolineaceae bacterium]